MEPPDLAKELTLLIFTETPIPGAFILEAERSEDERGFFARIWCQSEFEARGLDPRCVQASISFNLRRGTIRGMHYQAPPHEETKAVRCTLGAVYDVIIDLRPDRPSFKRWTAVELTSENRRTLYVPRGVAHGFQTLVDGTEVCYQMSESYHPESARGLRWDDPEFGIEWPLPDPIVSARDRSFRPFDRGDAGGG